MSFPKYPAYMDSHVEWIGRIPATWHLKPLKSVAAVVNGYPFDSTMFDPVEGHPLVRIRDLNRKEAEARYKGEFLDAVAITSEDVLVGMDGDFNVGRWLGEGRALLNQRMCCVRGNSPLVTRYLEYALPIPLKAINDVTFSTTVKHLSSAQVLKQRFAFPPTTDEVSDVVSFLDRETAIIDALIAEQRRLINLLQEKRRTLTSHAVTKGLNPDAPLTPSGISSVGDVPAHWVVAPLKRLAGVRTGVAKGKDNGTRETTLVPYLRVANVQDGYLDLQDVATIEIPRDDLQRYALQAGDVLMNEGGDFDKLGRGHIWHGEIEPCITQNHVFAVRPHGVSSEWLNAVTGSSYAQFYFMTRSKQSTNLASISSTNLMELPVVLPPVDEQRAILESVHGMTKGIDTLVGDARSAVSLLLERRSALISAAVTGQIDVRQLATSEAA